MEAGDVPGRLVEAKDGVEVPGGSVCTDHARMCLRIAPKHSVPEVMGHLKGKGAPVLFDHHPERGSRTGRGRTFWARGYYVSTVGPDEAVIRKYVRD